MEGWSVSHTRPFCFQRLRPSLLMPKRSWQFCQTSSDPSEWKTADVTSESCSLWSLGKTSKPSWKNACCQCQWPVFGVGKVVIFCNQTFSHESWRDLDSVFTFYIVLQQLGSEWVMFVAICQPRFGKVLWSVGRGYTWFCLAMLPRFMDSLHGCSSFFCCENMWGRLYGNLWCSWYSMVLL